MGFELKHTRGEGFMYAPKITVRPAVKRKDQDVRYRCYSTINKSYANFNLDGDFSHSSRRSQPEITIHTEAFKVIKRTPKGAWIEVGYGKKFVLDGAGKRYAHKTVALARESLIARQQMRLCILEDGLENTELTLYALKRLDGEGEVIPSIIKESGD